REPAGSADRRQRFPGAPMAPELSRRAVERSAQALTIPDRRDQGCNYACREVAARVTVGQRGALDAERERSVARGQETARRDSHHATAAFGVVQRLLDCPR